MEEIKPKKNLRKIKYREVSILWSGDYKGLQNMQAKKEEKKKMDRLNPIKIWKVYAVYTYVSQKWNWWNPEASGE